MARAKILKPGQNCWRVEEARRVAYLIDGAAYFEAFRQAVQRAHHTLYILGWDINSRIYLHRDPANGARSDALGEFLNRVVGERPDLQAYVLTWDFAMIYAMEREWLPIYQLGWRTHRRLHFELDDQHPVGASHHQKVVVVDDQIAFCGGLDLSKWRWDTPAHAPEAPQRRGPDEVQYPPFHDVQMLVEGRAAAALGDLARERWLRATGTTLTPPPAPRRGANPWPPRVRPDQRNVRIGIARTNPLYRDQPEVREVERAYLAAIAAARDSIYIENQYLTARVIQEALAERLEAPSGPEVVLVLPQKTGGWLEQHTMDVLRARLLDQLSAADHHGRLRVYCPFQPGIEHGSINVHAKVLVVDEQLARVGSANLSNRSMGFDTECDLLLEAENRPQRRTVASLRNRLLAEHLDVSERSVRAALDQHGSLLAAIDSLRSEGRSLRPLEWRVPTELDQMVPDEQLVDPEQPMDPDRLVARLVPQEEGATAKRKLLIAALIVLALLALAAAWRFTPMNEWVRIDALVGLLERVEYSPVAGLYVVGGYVIAGFAALPLSLLLVVTALVFDPTPAFAYSLLGGLTSAVLTYGVGHHLGRSTVRRLAGSRLNRLSQRLGERGLLAIIAVRMVPIAPFTVVNLVAGASHVRLRDFALGSLLGMAPGMLLTVLFVDQLASAFRRPDLGNVITVVALGAVAIAAVYYIKRRFQNRRKASA